MHPQTPTRTRARALAGLTLLLLPALSCGKRGDPRPPLRKTPQALSQFKLAQRGARLEVSGIAPRASTEGVLLRAMTIELLRADGDGDFLKLARKRAFIVHGGETFTEPESLPPPGTLVRIAARAVASGKRSALTTIMTLPAQPPPPAPTNLEAALAEGGVQLKWSGRRPTPLPSPPPPPATVPPAAATTGRSALPAVPTTPTPGVATAPNAAPPASPPAAGPAPPAPPELAAPVSRSGFWVYRRLKSAAYTGPLFPEPVSDKSHLDTEATSDQEWCYVVRAVVSSEPLIESDSSNEVCLTARDVAPPAAPGGLTVLAQPGGIEIRWSPSPERDLLAYRVYRASPEGTPEKIGEVAAPDTTYLDRTAAPGTAYRYTVTAVDRAGNESPPSLPLLGNLP